MGLKDKWWCSCTLITVSKIMNYSFSFLKHSHSLTNPLHRLLSYNLSIYLYIYIHICGLGLPLGLLDNSSILGIFLPIFLLSLF